MHNRKQLEVLIDNLPEFIFGAEGEEDAGSDSSDSSNESGSSSNEAGGAAGSSSDDDSQDSSHDDANDDATKGLKRALEAERRENKANKKELARLAKAEEDRALADKTEVEQATIRAERATERANKIAAGLVTRDLNDAIKAAAEKLNFIDTSDALEGVDRKELTVEQDEEDPTNITIDLKQIERLVKDLATKKPHFLTRGTDDGEPSGSQFGNKQQKKKSSADAYKDAYPSLR